MESRYVLGLCLLAVILPAVVLSAPAREQKRSVTFLENPVDTVALLEDLIRFVKETAAYSELKDKRKFDAGYSSRFSAANNYGSKLMALHAASDFRNPGRKRREAEQN